jgi:hypothetical protein
VGEASEAGWDAAVGKDGVTGRDEIVGVDWRSPCLPLGEGDEADCDNGVGESGVTGRDEGTLESVSESPSAAESVLYSDAESSESDAGRSGSSSLMLSSTGCVSPSECAKVNS